MSGRGVLLPRLLLRALGVRLRGRVGVHQLRRRKRHVEPGPRRVLLGRRWRLPRPHDGPAQLRRLRRRLRVGGVHARSVAHHGPVLSGDGGNRLFRAVRMLERSGLRRRVLRGAQVRERPHAAGLAPLRGDGRSARLLLRRARPPAEQLLREPADRSRALRRLRLGLHVRAVVRAGALLVAGKPELRGGSPIIRSRPGSSRSPPVRSRSPRTPGPG
jgi:hypothetical protein